MIEEVIRDVMRGNPGDMVMVRFDPRNAVTLLSHGGYIPSQNSPRLTTVKDAEVFEGGAWRPYPSVGVRAFAISPGEIAKLSNFVLVLKNEEEDKLGVVYSRALRYDERLIEEACKQGMYVYMQIE